MPVVSQAVVAPLEIFHRNALWTIYVYCYLLEYALDGYIADLLQDLATTVVRHCYSALCLAADLYFGITPPITRCFEKPKNWPAPCQLLCVLLFC